MSNVFSLCIVLICTISFNEYQNKGDKNFEIICDCNNIIFEFQVFAQSREW